MCENIRIQKILAQAGVCSRRKCEEFIIEGKIRVNGKVIHQMGIKVNPEKDVVFFEAQKICPHPKVKNIYIVMNKPRGYITSSHDERGRPTVLDLLPRLNERVFPVGRLDYNTEGLLLLTNDGELCYKLTHPKYNIPRKYLVKIKGTLKEPSFLSLKKGITHNNQRLTIDKIHTVRVTKSNSWVSVILHEGKNKEIKKFFETIGHPVLKLKRVKFFFLTLEGLEQGEYRFLTKEEVKKLKNLL